MFHVKHRFRLFIITEYFYVVNSKKDGKAAFFYFSFDLKSTAISSPEKRAVDIPAAVAVSPPVIIPIKPSLSTARFTPCASE